MHTFIISRLHHLPLYPVDRTPGSSFAVGWDATSNQLTTAGISALL